MGCVGSRSPEHCQAKCIRLPYGKHWEPGRIVQAATTGEWISRLGGDLPSSPHAAGFAVPLRLGSLPAGQAGLGQDSEGRQPGPGCSGSISCSGDGRLGRELVGETFALA